MRIRCIWRALLVLWSRTPRLWLLRVCCTVVPTMRHMPITRATKRAHNAHEYSPIGWGVHQTDAMHAALSEGGRYPAACRAVAPSVKAVAAAASVASASGTLRRCGTESPSAWPAKACTIAIVVHPAAKPPSWRGPLPHAHPRPYRRRHEQFLCCLANCVPFLRPYRSMGV